MVGVADDAFEWEKTGVLDPWLTKKPSFVSVSLLKPMKVNFNK